MSKEKKLTKGSHFLPKDYLNNLAQSVKTSSGFLLFAFVLFLLSSLITISQGVEIVQDWYYETLGRQSKILRDVQQLAPGMHIDYFISRLGSPIFINLEKVATKREGTPVAKKSYVFDLSPLFVVAAVDENGNVLAFSVTTTDPKVNPSLTLPNPLPKSTEDKVVLGKTRFSDIDKIAGEPISIAGGCGARRISYNEQYYYGNPGRYQYYIFSFNDMGLTAGLWKVNDEGIGPSQAEGVTLLCDLSTDSPQIPTELSDSVGLGCKDCYLESDKLRKIRQERVNTYTITAPFIDSSQLGSHFGPDSDQMRILPPQ